MTQQFVLVAAEDIASLRAEIAALRADIQRATISPENRWITIRDAAQRLGCSTRTIARKIDAGELEARGSGKARLVHLP